MTAIPAARSARNGLGRDVSNAPRGRIRARTRRPCWQCGSARGCFNDHGAGREAGGVRRPVGHPSVAARRGPSRSGPPTRGDAGLVVYKRKTQSSVHAFPLSSTPVRDVVRLGKRLLVLLGQRKREEAQAFLLRRVVVDQLRPSPSEREQPPVRVRIV